MLRLADDVAEAQPKQRICLFGLRLGTVGATEQPKGQQLRLH